MREKIERRPGVFFRMGYLTFRPRTASRTTTAVMIISTKTSPGPNKITPNTRPNLLT